MGKVQLYSCFSKLLIFIAAVRRHVLSCDSSRQALPHLLPWGDCQFGAGYKQSYALCLLNLSATFFSLLVKSNFSRHIGLLEVHCK